MEVKLFDSELKVMEALWEQGDMTAGGLAKRLNAQTGWNRNTTYTVIKKLVEKGAVQRLEPGFTCRAIITKEQVQAQEATQLVGKLFDGSAGAFLSAFLHGNELSPEEIDRLKSIVDTLQ